MRKYKHRRALCLLLAGILSGISQPAFAEKMVFDHRLYPPLKDALDSGNPDLIVYNGDNPRYIVDHITIKGKSSATWEEALEIIVRKPSKTVKTAEDWANELSANGSVQCPAVVSEHGRDDVSVTLEHRSDICPKAQAKISITRIITGKRSLFLLSFLSKTAIDDSQRTQLLALLNSAHLE